MDGIYDEIEEEEEEQLSEFYEQPDNPQLIQESNNIMMINQQQWYWKSHLDLHSKYTFKASLISRDWYKIFQIKTYNTKIEFLLLLRNINKQCKIGQFYLKYESGLLEYSIKICLYQSNRQYQQSIQIQKHQNVAKLFDFDENSDNYFQQDVENQDDNDTNVQINEFDQTALKLFGEDIKIFQFCFNQIEALKQIQNQNIQPIVRFPEDRINECESFIFCNQINEIIIYSCNENEYTFALNNLDGNILQTKLYQQILDEQSINKLKILLYNFLLPKQTCTFPNNKYIQTYFIQSNEIYCFYPQFPTLKQYLKYTDYKISIFTKIQILQKIYFAISYLHQYDIFHTFINLESIFILNNSILFLGHLEKVYTLATSQNYIYQNDQIYTPQELLQNRNNISRKTDIYQLGVLSFLLLFQEKELSFRKLKNKILCNNTINIEFIQFLQLCIHNNPSERPNIQELMTAINEAENQIRKKYL